LYLSRTDDAFYQVAAEDHDQVGVLCLRLIRHFRQSFIGSNRQDITLVALDVNPNFLPFGQIRVRNLRHDQSFRSFQFTKGTHDHTSSFFGEVL
jgi:hypothetical protein